MPLQSRRQFLQGSLAAAGLTLGFGCDRSSFLAPAPPKRPTVGYVGLGDPPATGRNPNFDAFVEGLRELGWVDGQSLTLQTRFTGGRAELMTELVGELVRLPVDVLVASGAIGAAAAATLTSTLPIVFA